MDNSTINICCCGLVLNVNYYQLATIKDNILKVKRRRGGPDSWSDVAIKFTKETAAFLARRSRENKTSLQTGHQEELKSLVAQEGNGRVQNINCPVVTLANTSSSSSRPLREPHIFHLHGQHWIEKFFWCIVTIVFCSIMWVKFVFLVEK